MGSCGSKNYIQMLDIILSWRENHISIFWTNYARRGSPMWRTDGQNGL